MKNQFNYKGIRIAYCKPDFVNNNYQINSIYIDDLTKIPYEIDDGTNIYQTKIITDKQSCCVRGGNFCLINGDYHKLEKKYNSKKSFNDSDLLLIENENDPINIYLAFKKNSKNSHINEQIVHYPDFLDLMRKMLGKN
jgi:hypothetical protein